tara:strand:+ start:770 stop:1213 length:444 start_codon:yes stop_codon:yes gene_type:complete
MKKKFKETKVGKFLSNNGSNIIETLGDVLPSQGILGIAKALISKDKVLSPENKQRALELLKIDIIEMQEVSKKWSSDMKSDSWLSKNTRPLTLIYLTIITSLYILLDSFDMVAIDGAWIELLKTLLVTIYVAYFGSRGFEKYQAIKK